MKKSKHSQVEKCKKEGFVRSDQEVFGNLRMRKTMNEGRTKILTHFIMYCNLYTPMLCVTKNDEQSNQNLESGLV